MIDIEECLFNHSGLDPKAQYYVAYSGGIDSTVLLHLLTQLQSKYQEQGQSFSLTALHVNHNLQDNSADWADHCAQICKEWGVALQQISLDLDDASEQSARAARYQWFREQMTPNSVLLTAHHQQDRTETLLFNLMRGAGSRGLSSLRSVRPFHGVKLARPLLSVTKDEIQQYVQQQKLSWVEDPSNQQTDYSRNYIRNNILPTLSKFRPDAVHAIARAAANLEQENSLLNEVAISDLVEVREMPKHPLDQSYALCYEDFAYLTPARQSNLLRFWLHSLQLHTPSKKLLAQLLTTFASSPSTTCIFQEEGCRFRFYKGFMYVMPALEELKPTPSIDWRNIEQPIDLYENKIRIDATSKLRDLVQAHSPSRLRLASKENVLNPKALQGHSLNLKKWLQEIGIPPWRRQALPLLTMNHANTDVVLGPVDQQLQSDWVLLECPVS